MKLWIWLLALALTNGCAHATDKVLRYAFKVAETGFDPAQVADYYSKSIVAGIFDAPLEYDFMARPYRLRPCTVTAMPEVGDGGRSLTFHVRPGLYFNDDLAFAGQRRELTAADYVYAIKRHYDSRWRSPSLYLLEGAQILGLSELRREHLAKKAPFDYDREVEGLRVLDRYTFQVRLAAPDPRFVFQFADAALAGAVAREVVEFYGDRIHEHPVGTNAWQLAQWRRGSQLVLTRNPNFREVRYAEAVPASDARLAAQVQALQGRKLPMVDRIEISIVEQSQPRWLSFLRAQADFIEDLPAEFAGPAVPHGQPAPYLAQRGIRVLRYARADVSVSYFNMEDPLVGGYDPAHIALRRAINLAVDLDREIHLVRRDQAVKSPGGLPSAVYGHDPAFQSEMAEFDPSRARALLDLYGYVDRDGDGWRDQPNGQPLVLEYATLPDGEHRQLAEQWQRNMAAVQIRMVFKVGSFAEQLKAASAGKLMMWGYGWISPVPDGDPILALGSRDAIGRANKARFNLDAYERLYRQQRQLPDGPQRLALMQQAQKLLIAYAPYKFHVHRIWTDMAHPWVKGYSRNIFVRDYWKYLDIDPAAQAAAH